MKFMCTIARITLPVLPLDRIHYRLNSHNDPVLPALLIVIQHDDQLIQLELENQ